MILSLDLESATIYSHPTLEINSIGLDPDVYEGHYLATHHLHRRICVYAFGVSTELLWGGIFNMWDNQEIESI